MRICTLIDLITKLARKIQEAGFGPRGLMSTNPKIFLTCSGFLARRIVCLVSATLSMGDRTFGIACFAPNETAAVIAGAVVHRYRYFAVL